MLSLSGFSQPTSKTLRRSPGPLPGGPKCPLGRCCLSIKTVEAGCTASPSLPLETSWPGWPTTAASLWQTPPRGRSKYCCQATHSNILISVKNQPKWRWSVYLNLRKFVSQTDKWLDFYQLVSSGSSGSQQHFMPLTFWKFLSPRPLFFLHCLYLANTIVPCESLLIIQGCCWYYNTIYLNCVHSG